MAKIAVEFEPHSKPFGSTPGQNQLVKRLLAHGDGWSVSDVLCNAGPDVRPTEEQHSAVCIAIVRTGSFQYQSSAGRALMSPGSLLLGTPGQYFECSHEHAAGDRCISFTYEPEYIEALTAEASVRTQSDTFPSLRVPPVCVNCPALLRGRVHVPSNRMSAPGAANLSRPGERLGGDRNRTGRRSSRLCKENFTQDFAGRGGESHSGRAHDRESPRCAARTQLVGTRGEAEPLSFSPNIPPAHRSYQYVMRSRLRHAAAWLLTEPVRIIDLALNCGFSDISNSWKSSVVILFGETDIPPATTCWAS